MPTSKIINFDDIGAASKVQVPNDYEGFKWTAYNPFTEKFEGDVYASTGGRASTSGTHSVQGLGFEMALLDSQLVFDARSIAIAAIGGFGDSGVPMDVTVIGYRKSEKVHSQVLNSSSGPIKAELNFNSIDKLQFIANAVEIFDVDDIAVTLLSPPDAPLNPLIR